MLKFIAPLLALVGFLGLPADNSATDSSSFGVTDGATAYGSSTAKGSIEF